MCIYIYNIHSVVPVTLVIDGGSKWLEKLINGKTSFCCVFIYLSIKNILFPCGLYYEYNRKADWLSS